MPEETSLTSPASEILEYLRRQPDAQDTIEGILRWWVVDQCVRNWTPKISEAVSQLVASGVLEEKRLSDGTTVFRALRSFNGSV
ncbi:MAG TPA: hypothetical protein VFI76_09860 [Terrimicrobiaceae bacterium]|nr:hypothetical protein [Terrimicrobiaceae bacterium]